MTYDLLTHAPDPQVRYQGNPKFPSTALTARPRILQLIQNLGTSRCVLLTFVYDFMQVPTFARVSANATVIHSHAPTTWDGVAKSSRTLIEANAGNVSESPLSDNSDPKDSTLRCRHGNPESLSP